MDTKHFKSLSKKWAFKFREDPQDIEQEITLFYFVRQAENKNLDIFRPGHEGALFTLLQHKIRGNNLESLGGTGDVEAIIPIQVQDEIEYPDETFEAIEKRCDLESKLDQELNEFDNLDNLAGTDLGETFGFTGANGRAILAQLKNKIIEKTAKKFGITKAALAQLKTEIDAAAEKRVTAKRDSARWAVENRRKARARQQMAMA